MKVKRAIDLKRGDFAKLGGREAIILENAKLGSNPVLCEVLATYPGNGNTGYVSVGAAAQIEVEVSPYSPAQTQAEELAAHLNELVVYCLGKDVSYDAVVASAKRGRALLDSITPPEPPTLAEALAAISSALEAVDPGNTDDPNAVKAREVLDRARRAKVI